MFNNRNWVKWVQAAAVRAIKTMAQTALAMFTVGQAMSEVDWAYVGSVAAAAGIYSVLTSLVGLPEVDDEERI